MTTILVVDDNKLSLRMIQQRLSYSGFEVMTAGSALEALEQIRVQDLVPDLVISDVLMPGMDGYAFCRELRSMPATEHTPIILLTSRGGVQEKVAGFQAGADDYLVKPVEPAELEVRIQALLARVAAVKKARGATRQQGRVITVFSLRGGAGVSSLAVNLAISLRQLWEASTSLVDCSLTSGHVLMMLDLKAQHTLANLAEHYQSGDLDREVIRGMLVRHESKVQVLGGIRRPEYADLIPPSLMPDLIAHLREISSYIVVDTASSFSEHNLELLDASDRILLVVNPEMASMQASTSVLDVFASLEYPEDKTVIVLNWTFPRGGLPQKSIEAALRAPIQAVIPYDETLFIYGINRGAPAVLSQPGAVASMAIQELSLEPSGAYRAPTGRAV